MTPNPIFMSPEHVSVMNARLAASGETKQACAALEKDGVLAFRLTDEDTGETIWWQMRFSRTEGASFALQQPDSPADLTLSCGYWAMVEGMKAQQAGRSTGPDMESVGDDSLMTRIAAAFAAARTAATIPIEWPQRPRVRSTEGEADVSRR